MVTSNLFSFEKGTETPPPSPTGYWLWWRNVSFLVNMLSWKVSVCPICFHRYCFLSASTVLSNAAAAALLWGKLYTRPRLVWPRFAPSFSSTKQTSVGKLGCPLWAHKHIDFLCTGLLLSGEAIINKCLVYCMNCFLKLRLVMRHRQFLVFSRH